MSNEWISVDAEKPKVKNICTRVLVNVNGYGIGIDKFIKKSQQFHLYHGYVTHWMPIPDVPNET